jgi:hypothetical protein
MLDGEGGYTVWGKLVPAADALQTQNGHRRRSAEDSIADFSAGA